MIAWASETAVAVSILILIVLLIRGFVGQMFGARAAYALWAAPLIRAVTPPLPAVSLPTSATAVLGKPNYQLIVTQAADQSSWSWSQALLLLWVVGAAVYLTVQLIRHHRFVMRALRHGRALQIEGVAYDVVASSAVHGPVATGLIHPLILVPEDFTRRFTPEQQRLALLHEQLHHRRGDIWASGAAMLVTALLWFNPLAHLALGAFRRDMEAACDARVLADAGADFAPAYAETILRCAASPVPRSLCALTAIDELKGRLTMLTSNHGGTRRRAGLLIAAATSVAGLALAIPAAAHDQRTKQEVFEKKIILHGAPGDKRLAQPGDLEHLRNHCDGQSAEISAAGGSGNKKNEIKLFICGDKGTGARGLADALSSAMRNIDRDNRDLDPKVKAELKAKIDAKIRELRSKG